MGKKTLLGSLYVIIFIALLTYSYTTFNIYFEFFVFCLFLIALQKNSLNKHILPFLIIILLYLFTSAIYSIFLRKNNVFDFILVYKTFIYFIFLGLILGKKMFDTRTFRKVFKLLLFAFLIKYIVSILVFNNYRPILFNENNYELMFLSLLFYLYYVIYGKVESIYQVLISIIFLLSGSKSGLLILLFVLFLVNIKILISRIYIIIPTAIALVILVFSVFKNRMGGEFDIEKIDRFKFLMVFLEETKNWTFTDFLFGAERITALSMDSCRKLSYYKELFSYENDGSCYSVIFHSYILRVIYDHGILIFLFMLLFIHKLIIKSGFSRKNSLAVIGIALINGLSVSSLNSIYFVLGLSFFLIIDIKNKEITFR